MTVSISEMRVSVSPHPPTLKLPQRQMKDMPEDSAGEIQRQPIAHVVSEIGRQRVQNSGQDRGNAENNYDQQQCCFPLERQDPINDSLKDKRLYQAKQPHHNRYDHEFDH